MGAREESEVGGRAGGAVGGGAWWGCVEVRVSGGSGGEELRPHLRP
jgi:hypothetical protein